MRFCIFLFLFYYTFSYAQPSKTDTMMVRNFFNDALSSRKAYNDLEFLCKKIGGRISGSVEAAAAVEFTHQIMLQMPFDTVYLQEVNVAAWKRGKPENARIISPLFGQVPARVTALGGSVGTGFPGLTSQVVEVESIEALKKMNTKDVEGKIVFFNKPFSNHHFYTFTSYGEVASSRVHGAAEAAKLGAIAVVVRSMTHAIDTFPHTGVMKYQDGITEIPGFAISTYDAEVLSAWLKKDPKLYVYVESHCYQLPDTKSYNVIGEVKGTTNPLNIITVCGHLDAWDNGEGAHDDGVGCMQSIEVARLFFSQGYQPDNTLRVVMMMDEEMNQKGANAYANETITEGERHYFAFESDRGGFSPHGFSVDADDTFIENMNTWFGILSDYGVYKIVKGYSGVDITPLKKYGTPLAALITDSQRYFDYQHAPSDTFETVNHREMQLGSATMTTIIYFIDKYGY